MMFDEERSRKVKATDEQCNGTVFCVNTTAHARARSSYEFTLYVFVRYALSRECQDSLSCWTRLALANEKEDERWRKELTWTSAQSFPSHSHAHTIQCQCGYGFLFLLWFLFLLSLGWKFSQQSQTHLILQILLISFLHFFLSHQKKVSKQRWGWYQRATKGVFLLCSIPIPVYKPE